MLFVQHVAANWFGLDADVLSELVCNCTHTLWNGKWCYMILLQATVCEVCESE